MPTFTFEDENGTKFDIEADDIDQASNVLSSFLANGGGEMAAPPQEPEVAAEEPAPQGPTLEETLQQSPLAQSISEQVGRYTDPRAQATTASALAGGVIGGTGLKALAAGGALGGAFAPAEDLAERAMNTALGGALGVVSKPIVAGGGWLVDKVSRGIESVVGMFRPETTIKKMVRQSLDAGNTTVADMKLAIQQAEQDGIPLHLDDIVNSPSLTALKQEVVSNPDVNSKAVAAFNKRTQNLVDSLEKSADALGPASVVTGDDVVALTKNALDSMNTARAAGWEKGMQEVQKLVGKNPITTGSATKVTAQGILDSIEAGEEFVSPGTEVQLRKVVDSLVESRGLNAEQIIARFKGFAKQSKSTNPDSWVWNQLKTSLNKDLQETKLAGPANNLLAQVRGNYANASQQIDSLKNSVLGRVYKQSTGGKEMAGSNFFKEVDRMDDAALAKFMPVAHSVSPEISGAIRARAIRKAVDNASDKAGIMSIDLRRLVNELPSEARFNALFNTGKIDSQTKLDVLNRVATAQRLAKSNVSLRPGGVTQGIENAAIDAGFILTGGGFSGFTVANILKRMRPAATYDLLTTPNGKKLITELEMVRRKDPGEQVAELTKGSAGYLADLIRTYGMSKDEL